MTTNEELLKNIVHAITSDTPNNSKDRALALIQSFRTEIRNATIDECKSELDLLATSVLSYGIDETNGVAYQTLKHAAMILDQLKTQEVTPNNL